MTELVLASSSVYRRTLLERLGVPFRWRAPDFDEEQAKRTFEDLEPFPLVTALARAKALSLRSVEPTATLIGSDQALIHQGEVLGKPGTTERSIAQLERLSGSSHQLVTALAVVQGHDIRVHLDVTTLRMRPLSRDQIERYVAADQPIDCAGSYKFEQRGIVLFDAIETLDPSAITGLPLIALTSLLRDLGWTIP